MRINLIITGLLLANSVWAQSKKELKTRLDSLEQQHKILLQSQANLQAELTQQRNELANAISTIIQLKDELVKLRDERAALPKSAPAEINKMGSQIAEKPTLIEFEEVEFDFGDVKEGEKVQHNFRFTNTGKNPLTIDNVITSCGCTAPEWTKKPILPTETGVITVSFDSHGKAGAQQKSVTVVANTIPSQTQLFIKAHVYNK